MRGVCGGYGGVSGELEFAARGSHGCESGLEVSAGAGGGCELAVCVDGVGLEPAGVHHVSDEGGDGGELVGGGSLAFEVAEDADAEIALVLIADVGSLIGEWSALPDAAGGVDEEVVADVAPVEAAVGASDGFEACLDGGASGVGEDAGADVVDGDASDGEHVVHQRGCGIVGGPGVSGFDAGGEVAACAPDGCGPGGAASGGGSEAERVAPGGGGSAVWPERFGESGCGGGSSCGAGAAVEEECCGGEARDAGAEGGSAAGMARGGGSGLGVVGLATHACSIGSRGSTG